jgi:hypothetical protein
MKKKKNFVQDEIIEENDIVRCIVTLNNGMHKTVRLAVDKFRTLFLAIKQALGFPFLQDRYRNFLTELEINPYQIDGCKFINERTGELILSL